MHTLVQRKYATEVANRRRMGRERAFPALFSERSYMNVFEAVKENVTARQAAEMYGIRVNRNTSALTDTDIKYLLLYFEENYGITSEKKIQNALAIVANENCYHPVQDCLKGLVWDGTPRIRSCLRHFLGADADDYVEEMLKHFLLGAVRRVFMPGSKYEEMLCLVGGQGAGKSTFFRLLAIKDEWFSDDLKKLDDDKVFTKLQGHWIIEMSEMLATSSANKHKKCRWHGIFRNPLFHQQAEGNIPHSI